VKRSFYYCG